MKKFLLVSALVAAQLPVLGQTAPTATAAQPADAELQAILKLLEAPNPMAQPGGSRSQQMLESDKLNREYLRLARAYLATHPSGPDRARVILGFGNRSPQFISEIKPGFDAKPSVDLIVYDTAARDAFARERRAWLESVKNDRSAEAEQRLAARHSLVSMSMNSAETPAELDALQAEIEAMAADGAEERRIRTLQSNMLYGYAGQGIAAYERYLARLAASNVPVIRTIGEEAKASLENQKASLDKIRFTAADGREVDLSKLRGKVVLIDFWATWCGPCIAELPNLISVYNKYHDRGFEVIGISFENPGIVDEAGAQRMRQRNPDAKPDTPEQAAAKLAAAKQKMLDFTAERKMPWPQHYDGKHWSNEFGRMFGIRAIPAMFLVDRQGRLVSTGARGEKLEPLVKKLIES